MYFITRKALPRRTFLRGVGATLALPLLDAMIPAATAASRTLARPVSSAPASTSAMAAPPVASATIWSSPVRAL